MSRNSSGNYALPTGNPVVTGTTITSDWANETIGDLASEMTDSLNRSGKGAMLAPLKATDGTAAAPSVTFSNDPDTGLYRVSDNTVAVAANSTQAQRWTSTGTTIPVAVSALSTLGVTEAVTASNGITATRTTSGGIAGTFTGNGSGHGVLATGGSSSGYGVRAVGGAPNGGGLIGIASGTGYGVDGVGGASGGGGIFSPGTAATATARTASVVAYQGDISFSGTANPNSNVALSNTLTPKNVVKAWATIQTTGSPGSRTVSILDGFNVTSVAFDGTGAIIQLTFATAFANTNYAPFVTMATRNQTGSGTSSTTTLALITAADSATGATYNFNSDAFSVTIYIMVLGAQ